MKFEITETDIEVAIASHGMHCPVEAAANRIFGTWRVGAGYSTLNVLSDIRHEPHRTFTIYPDYIWQFTENYDRDHNSVGPAVFELKETTKLP